MFLFMQAHRYLFNKYTMHHLVQGRFTNYGLAGSIMRVYGVLQLLTFIMPPDESN